MNNPLRIGIAGLGTVGCGLVNLLHKHAALIEQRAGRAIEITAVSTRDPDKDRPIDASNLTFVSSPLDLATADNVDVVVELIGGDEGIAKELAIAALKNGKPLVTANKALIAHHGLELAGLAEENNVLLAFEAAVAGGIPVVKAVRESLVGNQCSSIYGILNGTSNYILSEMNETKRPFADVLKEAQDKGYAEADPTFDIDGIDAAHKVVILSSIAFGAAPNMNHIQTQGIRDITLTDLDYAKQLGYAIKLLGSASVTDGKIAQYVCPHLVPQSSPLAHVNGVLNAVSINCDMADNIFLEGPGAGADATASSVAADITDIARGLSYFAFGKPAESLARVAYTDTSPSCGYYMRMQVEDQAGVLADITRILHGQNISVDILIQPRHIAGQPAELVLTTHPTTDHAMSAACAAISVLPIVTNEPQLIRIMS